MIDFLRRNRVLLASGVLLVAAASLVLRSGGSRVRSDRLGELFLEILAPLQRVVSSVGGGFVGVWRGVGDVWDARREVVLLREQVRTLEQEAVKAEELAQENERLRGLLGLRERLLGDVLTARVIARDATGTSQTLVIDRGESDGVKRGGAVLAPHGIVGQIFQVSDHAARVLLITDHNSGVDGLVQRSRAPGIVEGSVDGGLRLKFSKRTDDVQVSDRVVTSGLDGIFPKGLPIGHVTSVDKRGQSMFQTVEIAPAIDVGQLEELMVTRGAVNLTELPAMSEE